MGMLKQRKKEISFSLFYLQYFGGLTLALLLCAALCFGGFVLAAEHGLIYPANYAEQQAQAAAQALSVAPAMDAALVPDLCHYAFFDPNGELLASDLSGDQLAEAQAIVREGLRYTAGFYKSVERPDGICLLRYELSPQYVSPALRRLLPNPQNLMLCLLVLSSLSCILATALLFGRALSRRLLPLQLAAAKIQVQELDFTPAPSGIREINRVILAMDQMRRALKDALLSQWQAHQRQQEALRALTHDLKTPLTVIQGNADLLLDTELDEEQRSCAGYIRESTEQLRRYVKALLELTRCEQEAPLHLVTIPTQDYLQSLVHKARGLCQAQALTLRTELGALPKALTLDPDLMDRAVLNVLSNALEHSPRGAAITLAARLSDGCFTLTITDEGKGFSPDALTHGTERFYMEDASRSRSLHYGLGLSIAEGILRRHAGRITLENAAPHGGRVTLAWRCENAPQTGESVHI